MSFISSIRDGENIGEAMVQRGQQAQLLAGCPVVGGVGTGFNAGVVGKMNAAAGADPNHFSVQANGSNLVLTIRPGWAWIVKDNGSSTFDPRVVYIVMNAAVTLTLPSNSQGTSRTDTICLRFDQALSPDATGSNLPTIVDVQGGASNALGNAPGDGALYLPLANVVIANGAASVAQSNVTDRRFVHPDQAKFKGVDLTARSMVSAAVTPFFVAPTNGSGAFAGYDYAGMYQSGTGSWQAPVPGRYRVYGSAALGAAQASDNAFLAVVTVGVPSNSANWVLYGSWTPVDTNTIPGSRVVGSVTCNYGDNIYMGGYNGNTTANSWNSTGQMNDMSLEWIGW